MAIKDFGKSQKCKVLNNYSMQQLSPRKLSPYIEPAWSKDRLFCPLILILEFAQITETIKFIYEVYKCLVYKMFLKDDQDLILRAEDTHFDLFFSFHLRLEMKLAYNLLPPKLSLMDIFYGYKSLLSSRSCSTSFSLPSNFVR